jgi:excisionase family DNA binding protein
VGSQDLEGIIDMPVVGDNESQHQPANTPDARDAPRTPRPEHRPGVRPEGPGAPAHTLWDVRQVAAYLQIPVSSIYKMTARHPTTRIPHIRIGGKLRFRQADIDRWLELLTTSNIPALTKLRRNVSKGGTYGDDP